MFIFYSVLSINPDGGTWSHRTSILALVRPSQKSRSKTNIPPNAVKRFRRAVAGAELVRRGLRDFAEAEDGGNDVHIRTWNATRRRYNYTRAGRGYIRQNPVDYICLLPVRIATTRRGGRVDSYYGFFPITSLAPAMDAAITRAIDTNQGRQAVKARVLRWMQDQGIGGLEHRTVDDGARGE